jgi:2'-hydroxyisoflavone reductase
LAEQGVTPALLPLWTGADDPEFALAMDPARAVAAGLRARPLGETAADTLAWSSDPSSRWSARSSWLTAEREQALLGDWATR